MVWDKIEKGVFVIAEIGKGFIQSEAERPVEEYLDNAKRLVDEALRAGCDAVKFQTHTVDDEQLNINVVAPHFKGADRYSWVTRNTRSTPADQFWKPLKSYCDEKKILFFSTPMSRGAARLLDSFGVELWKIGSGDILDFVMLDYLRRTDKPIIISSGMSTFAETKKAVDFLREKNDKVALLHCVSKYPCPPEELNLKTICYYKEKFDMPIGFSDHSISVDTALVAVAMGATVIEKHFSLDRTLWGSDHKVSLTPSEMSELVRSVRELEENQDKKDELLRSDFAKSVAGVKRKLLQDDESVFRPLFRKSLMAAADLPEGTILGPEHFYAMRPQQYAGGLPSEEYSRLLGSRLKKGLHQYDPIKKEDLVSEPKRA